MTQLIRARLFASLRDVLDSSEVELRVPSGATVGQLKTILLKEYPALAPYAASIIIAVNRSYASDEEVLPDNAEVACFPPVTGGSGRPVLVRVQSERIDLDQAVGFLSTETVGGICLFTGVVRGLTEIEGGKRTEMLEYVSYQPMAMEKLDQVVLEMFSRWPELEGVVLVQRTGRLKAGEISTLAACSASHRDRGIFEAAQYAIDRIKEIVPVWKKEYGPDGQVWVEGNYLPREGD